MLHISGDALRRAGTPWKELIAVHEAAVRCLDRGDYVQPLKPYLRYGNPSNRIIAMPAYAGAPFCSAGIKWIGSFPGNLTRGLPRAHCIVVLNDAETGRPAALFSSALISEIRTASVSGMMLKHYLQWTGKRELRIGFVGWGPVGRMHAKMCEERFGDRILSYVVFDKRKPDFRNVGRKIRSKALPAAHWKEVYEATDVVFTCTSGGTRYMDRPPAEGQLLMHVSLRDYTPGALNRVRQIVVDDWKEVCREDTDIERLHTRAGLQKEDCMTLAEVVCRDGLKRLNPRETLLFAPMGMAVFDICTAHFYYQIMKNRREGTELPL